MSDRIRPSDLPYAGDRPSGVGFCKDTNGDLLWDSGSSISQASAAGGISVSPSNTAAQNKTIIQSALNSAGNVNLIGQGVIEVDDTLVIYSDTKLTVSPELTIKLADNVNKNLLVNASRLRPDINISTATCSGNTVTIVTSAAHGFSTGDLVAINWCASPGYNGIHTVTVSNATTFTYTTRRNLAASSVVSNRNANMVCKLADSNIKLIGGTWDFNQANQPTVNGTIFTMAIIMQNVRDLVLSPDAVLNAKKYAIYPANVENYYIGSPSGIEFNTVSDGVHVSGPAYNGVIDGVRGVTGDDGVALIPRDKSDYAYTIICEGDIENVLVDNVDVHSTTSGIAIYNHDTSAFKLRGIKIRNFSPRNTGLKILGIDAPNVVTVDDIEIDTIRPTFNASAYILLAQFVNFKKLVIKNTFIDARDKTATTINPLLQNTTIEEFIVDGVYCDNDWLPSATAYLVNIPATCKKATIKNVKVFAGNNNVRLFNTAAGTIDSLSIDGVHFKGNASNNVGNIVAGCTIKSFSLSNVAIDTAYLGIACNETVTVNCHNVYGTGVTGGLFQGATGKTVTVTGQIDVAANKLFLPNSGTMNLKSWNISADVSVAGFNNTNGNFANHTGTTNPGLALATGTGWKRAHDAAVIV